jgi:hypothetical protein
MTTCPQKTTLTYPCVTGSGIRELTKEQAHRYAVSTMTTAQKVDYLFEQLAIIRKHVGLKEDEE